MNPVPPQDKPLQGRRIVVTRTRQQAGKLSSGLRELGAEVVELPTIEIIPPESYQPLDDALLSLGSYQWLVVTSANTARVIGERITLLGLKGEIQRRQEIQEIKASQKDSGSGELSNCAPGGLNAQGELTAQQWLSKAISNGLKIAAVGPSTAEALTLLGATPHLVPAHYVAESLVDSLAGALGDQVRGSRVLLARASAARDVIPDELRRLGAVVDVVDAYRTMRPENSLDQVRALFANRKSDPGSGGEADEAESEPPHAVTFTSSSTVNHFLSLLSDAGVERPPGLAAISIGPITSATLREQNWEPAAEALDHDVAGLIEATVRALNRWPLNRLQS